MSFLSERSPSQMVGGVIALLVAGYCVRFLLAGGVEEYFSPSKRIESQLVAALEQRPGDLAILRAMEQHFPLDYDNLLEGMAEQGVAGGTEEQVIAVGSQYLRRFMAGHRNDFAAAPTPYLDGVLASEMALLRQLASESPVACDDYVKGRLEYDDPLSDDADRLLGESAAAYVEAMAAGRRDQQLRLATTPADLTALGRTLAARGATAEQIAALDSGDFARLEYDDQCDAVLRLVEAIDAQPEARQALLTATFLGPV
jgi:hypothetical protein